MGLQFQLNGARRDMELDFRAMILFGGAHPTHSEIDRTKCRSARSSRGVSQSCKANSSTRQDAKIVIAEAQRKSTNAKVVINGSGI